MPLFDEAMAEVSAFWTERINAFMVDEGMSPDPAGIKAAFDAASKGSVEELQAAIALHGQDAHDRWAQRRMSAAERQEV